MKRSLPRYAFLAAALWISVATISGAVSPDIVISQVYGGGGNVGATYTHDYIELFNRGTTSISLTGWSVQYASAAGTGNFGATSGQLTELSGSLAPGQYLLIQEASTAAVGSALPAPDIIDSTPIAMSGTAGKVALVTDQTSLGCNGGSTVCTATQLARVKDMVGYGNANFFEGPGAAPTLSNTLSAFRASGGCLDTDSNAADFTAATPAPRNTATIDPCQGDAAPSITSKSPDNGATNVAVSSNVTVTFSEPVNVTDPWYSISCGTSGSHTAAVTGGPTVFTIDPDANFANGESCTVTVFGGQVSDQDTNDPPDTLSGNPSWSFATIELTGCDQPATLEIAAVQGSGNSTPLAGQTVRVEGVVTGDFQGTGGLGGFYIQDDTPDADPATSEGLFVFNTSFAASVGDRVFVSGTATESFGLTQLSSVTSVDVCSTGNPITALSYDLPRAAGVTFEPVENMLLTFPETLTATEHFQLGRFGEVTVSVDGRLFEPTTLVAPGAAANAMQAANDQRRLLIDDGSNVQNPSTVPFLTPDVLRLGDTATGITGVLSFGFGFYRLQPTATIAFARTNPRPPSPVSVGGDIRVASFNTLNYFTTLGSENSNARGANTAEEFARQQAKEVAAITGLDADVLGLMEIENNGATAIGSLVDALNDATAPGTYAYITEPVLNTPNEFGGTFGTDAIKVALIYRPAAVTPVGGAQSSADPVFDRPPLIQTFQLAGGSEPFTVAVNHFKSKNCGGATLADLDQGDGQSCFNARRVQQASALATLLDTLDAPNALIIGDLNSHTEEDPIHTLEAAGYTGLSEAFVSEEQRYSFVFNGQSGELDHALAGADLLDNVTGATIWHINADEPLFLDYNTEFKPPALLALYQPDAYRSSDHDPIVVGLDLEETPTLTALSPARIWVGLANSDDAGIKFDLRAEIYRNGIELVGFGEIASAIGGSSGFNNAKLDTIPLTLTAPVAVGTGDTLSIKLLVRNACFGSGKNSGRARLWFNDAAANSRFDTTIDGSASDWYLRDALALAPTPGPGPKKTIDVQAGAKCSAYKPFETWTATLN